MHKIVSFFFTFYFIVAFGEHRKVNVERSLTDIFTKVSGSCSNVRQSFDNGDNCKCIYGSTLVNDNNGQLKCLTLKKFNQKEVGCDQEQIVQLNTMMSSITLSCKATSIGEIELWNYNTTNQMWGMGTSDDLRKLFVLGETNNQVKSEADRHGVYIGGLVFKLNYICDDGSSKCTLVKTHGKHTYPIPLDAFVSKLSTTSKTTNHKTSTSVKSATSMTSSNMTSIKSTTTMTSSANMTSIKSTTTMTTSANMTSIKSTTTMTTSANMTSIKSTTTMTTSANMTSIKSTTTMTTSANMTSIKSTTSTTLSSNMTPLKTTTTRSYTEQTSTKNSTKTTVTAMSMSNTRGKVSTQTIIIATIVPSTAFIVALIAIFIICKRRKVIKRTDNEGERTTKEWLSVVSPVYAAYGKGRENHYTNEVQSAPQVNKCTYSSDENKYAMLNNGYEMSCTFYASCDNTNKSCNNGDEIQHDEKQRESLHNDWRDTLYSEVDENEYRELSSSLASATSQQNENHLTQALSLNTQNENSNVYDIINEKPNVCSGLQDHPSHLRLEKKSSNTYAGLDVYTDYTNPQLERQLPNTYAGIGQHTNYSHLQLESKSSNTYAGLDANIECKHPRLERNLSNTYAGGYNTENSTYAGLDGTTEYMHPQLEGKLSNTYAGLDATTEYIHPQLEGKLSNTYAGLDAATEYVHPQLEGKLSNTYAGLEANAGYIHPQIEGKLSNTYAGIDANRGYIHPQLEGYQTRMPELSKIRSKHIAEHLKEYSYMCRVEIEVGTHVK